MLQHNRASERMNITLMERERCMRTQAGVPSPLGRRQLTTLHIWLTGLHRDILTSSVQKSAPGMFINIYSQVVST
ncbi:unnamed protein product [Prunus armeniaca]